MTLTASLNVTSMLTTAPTPIDAGTLVMEVTLTTVGTDVTNCTTLAPAVVPRIALLIPPSPESCTAMSVAPPS